jgi:WD40 repeat protein
MQGVSDRKVVKVAISQDSQIIACVIHRGMDRILMAWDSNTGRLKWSNKSMFEKYEHQDGDLFFVEQAFVFELTVGGGIRVLSLDPENGIVTKDTKGYIARIMPDRYPRVIDYPLDGTASVYLRTPRVYWPMEDETTAETIIDVDSSQSHITSRTLSECGSFLIHGMATKCVKVWEVQSGKLLRTLDSHAQGWILCVACSPDAEHIGGGGNAIEVWHTDSGNLVSTLRGHTLCVNSIVFSHDGQQVISGSEDGTVKIWDWALAEGHMKVGHTLRVTSVSFSPNDGGTLVSTSWDGTMFVWNILSNSSPQVTDPKISLHVQSDFLSLSTQQQCPMAMGAISSDGEWLALLKEGRTMQDEPTRYIDMLSPKKDGPSLTLISRLSDTWNGLTLSKDGALVAVASPRSCRIYSIHEGSSQKLFQFNPRYAAGEDVKMTFSDQGTLLLSTRGAAFLVRRLNKEGEEGHTRLSISARLIGVPDGASTHPPMVSDGLIANNQNNLVVPEHNTHFTVEEHIHDTPHDLRMSAKHLILITQDGKQEKRKWLQWKPLPDGTDTIEQIHFEGQAFYMHDGWIKDAGSDFKCWIPSIYRGRDCYSVSGNHVVLGGEDGGIMLIKLCIPTSGSQP